VDVVEPRTPAEEDEEKRERHEDPDRLYLVAALLASGEIRELAVHRRTPPIAQAEVRDGECYTDADEAADARHGPEEAVDLVRVGCRRSRQGEDGLGRLHHG